MKKVEFDNALNEAGWAMIHELQKFGGVGGRMFNNMKPCLKVAIEKYLSESDKEKPVPQTKEVEWVNGLPTVGVECELSNCGNSWAKAEVLFMGTGLCVVNQGYGDQHYHLNSVKFRKPETPEQKLERERLEAAYDLYCEWMLDGNIQSDEVRTIEEFVSYKNCLADWLRIVDKTNYRKGVK